MEGTEQRCSLPFLFFSLGILTLVPHLSATRGIIERLWEKLRAYDLCLQISVGPPWSRGNPADMSSRAPQGTLRLMMGWDEVDYQQGG